MTAVQAFFQFLYLLQHATSQAMDVTATGHVTYGGSALQAFLNALYSHGTQTMVWIDNAS